MRILALALLLATPAQAQDFDQVVLGADLLQFNGGELSGNLNARFSAYQIDGWARALPPSGPRVGFEVR